MHLIRRAAFRAASAPSASFSRSISTSTPFVLRSKVQSSISTSVFRRFNSDEASERRADGEQGPVTSAIESASESPSTNTPAAHESSEGTEAGGFEPRQYQERAPRSNGNENYAGRRGGNDRGARSGGYGRDAAPPVTKFLQPCPSIYVGNLLFDITSADLQREFYQFGKIVNTIIAQDPRGLSKGFGYIEFETTEAATAAIEARNQTVFEGRRLIVNYMAKQSRDRPENPPSKTLFIGNLAFEMSDADLNKLFRDIKNVIDVRVAIDRRTGQPRGFAHADFVDIESAVKARDALTDKEVYGRKLRVDFSAGSREVRGVPAAPAF